MQTRVLDECTMPFVLDDAGRTTEERKKLVDLLLDIFNGGGIANCNRVSKSTTSPIITMNDWILADLYIDRAVISRATLIPFVKVTRNPVDIQGGFEKELDEAMKNASQSIGQLIKFGEELRHSENYFQTDLVPFLQQMISDDRLLQTYGISLFAAEKVLEFAEYPEETTNLRKYFREVICPFGILPYQAGEECCGTNHLMFLEQALQVLSEWSPEKVKTILISNSNWKNKQDMVPAIAIRLKECLDELAKGQYKHLPESVIRKGIREFDLGATTNTSQWFLKRDATCGYTVQYKDETANDETRKSSKH
ncbi:uncharacterized protein LOC114576326 [Exaiptasia diaphana]|uniref:Uncharacterized protein n=1 Tax=Exaiptasia diaphana TaxID=2652724 RepID=A0A913YU32_EXADI|nr:uncharacterized protein LOC114576326 [Exaiptasia diaphana]KXJ29150.1 hypothetical protein AC249_AIPGENE16996 [Exaiptasia diaphana]